MMANNCWHIPHIFLCIIALVLGSGSAIDAQMITGARMPGFTEAFDLSPSQLAKDYSIEEIAVTAGSTTGVNVLLPGEHVSFTFRFKNQTSRLIKASGVMQLISYRTQVPAGEVWAPHVTRIANECSTPFQLSLPPSGTEDIVIEPRVPERFGGYVLVADVADEGRSFAAALARSITPDTGRVQFPTYALDATWPQFMNENVLALFE